MKRYEELQLQRKLRGTDNPASANGDERPATGVERPATVDQSSAMSPASANPARNTEQNPQIHGVRRFNKYDISLDRCIAVFFLNTMLVGFMYWRAKMMERSLRINQVTGVYELNSAGQLIPLILSVGNTMGLAYQLILGERRDMFSLGMDDTNSPWWTRVKEKLFEV